MPRTNVGVSNHRGYAGVKNETQYELIARSPGAQPLNMKRRMLTFSTTPSRAKFTTMALPP